MRWTSRQAAEAVNSTDLWYDGGAWTCQAPNGVWIEHSEVEMLNILYHRLKEKAIFPAQQKQAGSITFRKQVLGELAGMCYYSGNTNPPGYLGTPAGIIDLSTGQVVPADRVPGRVAAQTAVSPAQQYEEWVAYILDWMDGDADAARWLQATYGRIICGKPARELLVHLGVGANGKSLYHSVLRSALGDYAATIDIGAVLSAQHCGPTPDLYRLRSVRLCIGSETDMGQWMSAAKAKRLAGGTDSIVARGLYRDPVEYRPQYTVVLMSNHMPSWSLPDQALWDRLRVVPWRRRYAHDQAVVDSCLSAEMQAQALAWLISGARMRVDGLPSALQMAGREAREDSSPLAVWSNRPDRPAGLEQLYAAYLVDAQAAGERPVSRRAFARLLEEAGWALTRTRACNLWAPPVERGERLP